MASTPTRKRVSVRDFAFRRCGSYKVGYGSFEAAMTAADLMMLADRVDPGCHMTPYECDECGEWHVGNKRVVQTVPVYRPSAGSILLAACCWFVLYGVFFR